MWGNYIGVCAIVIADFMLVNSAVSSEHLTSKEGGNN
jgi:hypothetical protein